MGPIIRTAAVRLAVAAVVLLGVLTVTFFMMRLAPGGPFTTMKGVSPELAANLDKRFGLDEPVSAQFFSMLGGYLKGDLGPSMSFSPGEPVADILARSFPVSLELGFWALVLALVLGVTFGTLSGLRPGGPVDLSISFVMLGLVSASIIVVGALLRKVFIVDLGWFSLGGFDGFSNKVLPSLTLGLAYTAILGRLVRGGVTAQAGDRTLRSIVARGVDHKTAVVKYVVPRALIPMLTYLGPAVAGILTGSFVVETLFEVPGVSACFIQGAAARDYTLVSGAIMTYTAVLVVANLLFETLHTLLDPRERK